MAAVDPHGDQKYWINGEPYQGVRFQPAPLGRQSFWLEGLPEENLTPKQNFDTGKMFLTFEG